VSQTPVGTSPPGLASADRRDFGWLIVLGAVWGSAFPVIRLGLLAGASPFGLGAVRFALAAAVMAAIAAARRDRAPDRRSALILVTVGGVGFIGTYAAFLNSGEEAVSGGLAAILVGTLPLWTALLGFAFLPEERVGRLGAVGLAAGFGGLLVLFLPAFEAGAFSNAVAEAEVVGAAITGAAGAIALRRLQSGPPGGWGLTLQFAAAAALLGTLAFLPGSGWAFPVNAGTLGSAAYLACAASVGGYGIYFGLLHRTGALRANLVAYVNPLAGLLIGIALLGEGVGTYELAGFALVLLGLFLFHRERLVATRARSAGPR
jgi:probable blue pigment (indigoidine) exporter